MPEVRRAATWQTESYRPPTVAYKADRLPPPAKDWYEQVCDHKFWTDSIFLGTAIRKEAEGRLVYRLHLLGCAFKIYVTEILGIPHNGTLPLDYVRAALRPHLGKEHRTIWRRAKKWGVVHYWEKLNACTFVAHDKLSRPVFHNALKFTLRDAEREGSVAQYLWVSHCEVRQSFKEQYKKSYTYKEENAHLSCLFMQALNAFGMEWSLALFGKVLDRHPETLTAHSKASRETVIKRSVLVEGVPSAKNWRNEDRPQELQNGLPMPVRTKDGLELVAIIDKARSMGMGKFFLYYNKKKDTHHAAYRIPNLHTRHHPEDRAGVRPSYRNGHWGHLSKLDSVQDVIERANREEFTPKRRQSLIGKYHKRRIEIQTQEIRNRHLEGDERQLTLSVIKDIEAQKKVQAQQGGVAYLNYPLGNEIGRVVFPTRKVASSGPRQARNIGSARASAPKGASSLQWTNPPRRRPWKQGHRKYIGTKQVTVREYQGHAIKEAQYKSDVMNRELRRLGIKPSQKRIKVKVLSRGRLKDKHARRPTYCLKCNHKTKSHPHPLWHDKCSNCGSLLALGGIV